MWTFETTASNEEIIDVDPSNVQISKIPTFKEIHEESQNPILSEDLFQQEVNNFAWKNANSYLPRIIKLNKKKQNSWEKLAIAIRDQKKQELLNMISKWTNSKDIPDIIKFIKNNSPIRSRTVELFRLLEQELLKKPVNELANKIYTELRKWINTFNKLKTPNSKQELIQKIKNKIENYSETNKYQDWSWIINSYTINKWNVTLTGTPIQRETIDNKKIIDIIEWTTRYHQDSNYWLWFTIQKPNRTKTHNANLLNKRVKNNKSEKETNQQINLLNKNIDKYKNKLQQILKDTRKNNILWNNEKKEKTTQIKELLKETHNAEDTIKKNTIYN